MIGVQLLLGLTLWLKGADEAIIQLRIPPSNWPQRIWTPSLIQELHRAYQERLFAFFLWDENLSFRLFHSAYLGHFQQENQRRQEFASFALRRFMEYHIEQVIREKPSLKPVVETKQKIENWQVQLPKNIQIKMSYQLTTNELHLIVENLGFDQWRYRGRMDPQKWGPGPFLIQEWWLINHMANRKWLLGFFWPQQSALWGLETTLSRWQWSFQVRYNGIVYPLEKPFQDPISRQPQEIFSNPWWIQVAWSRSF